MTTIVNWARAWLDTKLNALSELFNSHDHPVGYILLSTFYRWGCVKFREANKFVYHHKSGQLQSQIWMQFFLDSVVCTVNHHEALSPSVLLPSLLCSLYLAFPEVRFRTCWNKPLFLGMNDSSGPWERDSHLSENRKNIHLYPGPPLGQAWCWGVFKREIPGVHWLHLIWVFVIMDQVWALDSLNKPISPLTVS